MNLNDNQMHLNCLSVYNVVSMTVCMRTTHPTQQTSDFTTCRHGQHLPSPLEQFILFSLPAVGERERERARKAVALCVAASRRGELAEGGVGKKATVKTDMSGNEFH